jgi:hypothetical protein
MNVKRGSVLFYHEIGFIAETIQKDTKGLYNHVEICIEDNISIQIRPAWDKGGIKLIDLTFKELELKKGEYIDIMMPKWIDMNAGILKARELYHKVIGYSLGNISAWWSGIERLRKEHDKSYESDEWLICSELGSKSFAAGGTIYHGTIQEHSYRSPNDLLLFEFFDNIIRIEG